MKGADSDPGKLPAPILTNNKGFAYPGRELEAMANAANYHRWILDIFQPYLGRNLVEVGAGIGSFSELLLELHSCETLSLVEPSKGMYEQLVANAKQLQTATRLDTYHSAFTDAAPLIKAQH